MEGENVLNICHGCLSTERIIYIVTGALHDIFYKLRNEVIQTQGEFLLLCWECVANVKKFKVFQDKIKNAQVLLQEYSASYWIQGETILPSCLSTLTTIHNNSFKNIYYEEEIKKELSCNENNEINNLNSNIEGEPSCNENNEINNFNSNIEGEPSCNENNEINNLNSNIDGIKERLRRNLRSKNDSSKNTEEYNLDGQTEVKLESNDDVEEENRYSDDNNDMDDNNDDNKEITSDSEDQDCDKDDNSSETDSDKEFIVKLKNSQQNTANVTIKRQNSTKNYIKYVKVYKNEDISIKNFRKLCEKIQFNQEEYSVVMKEELERNRVRFKCKICDSGFFHNIDLHRHTSFEHNVSGYPQKCVSCKTLIRSKELLTKHWNRNHTVMLKCTLCSKSFWTENIFQKHLREIHQYTYTCITCGFVCSTMAKFKQHYDSHELVQCNICGVKLKNNNVLAKHIKCKHGPVKCTICNEIFETKRKLRYHKITFHPKSKAKDELSYCVECDKQFDSVFKYKCHLNYTVKHANTNDKVPCPECGKMIIKTALERHNNIVHLKISKFYCEKCKKYYSTKCALKSHIKLVHDKFQPPKNKFCDLCGRGFATNRILVHHLRTHTGERPYKCEYCPAAFAQKTARNTHQKSQHKLVATSSGAKQ